MKTIDKEKRENIKIINKNKCATLYAIHPSVVVVDDIYHKRKKEKKSNKTIPQNNWLFMELNYISPLVLNLNFSSTCMYHLTASFYLH